MPSNSSKPDLDLPLSPKIVRKKVRFALPEYAPLTNDSSISDVGEVSDVSGPALSDVSGSYSSSLDLPASPLVFTAQDAITQQDSDTEDEGVVFTVDDMIAMSFARGSETTHQFVTTEASPALYPSKIIDINTITGKDINIGDLHGNAMAMVHYLVKFGILSISSEKYEELYQAYQIISKNEFETKPKELEAAISTFCCVIDAAIVNHPTDSSLEKPLVRFLGDVLCDRGANDFITLSILKKLKQSGVNYQIIWSNHDSLFLQEYYVHINQPAGFGDHIHTLIVNEQFNHYFNSLFSMQEAMISRSVTSVTKEKIKELVEYSYLPNLSLMAAELRADGVLDVFSHAPICLSQILDNSGVRDLLTKKGVDVAQAKENMTEFQKAVDILNRYFQDNLVQLVKAINTMDKAGQAVSKLLASAGYRDKFKRETGIELELVDLFEMIMADQRYDSITGNRLIDYYINNPTTGMLFSHRKFNGHDNLVESTRVSFNPTHRLAKCRLRTSYSLNSDFGNAMHEQQGIESSCAEVLVASRKAPSLQSTSTIYRDVAVKIKPVDVPPVDEPTVIERIDQGFCAISSVFRSLLG